MDTVEWFGGDREAYADSRSGSIIGRYTASVDDLHTPYARPQENGQRLDVDWAVLTGPGASLRITGEPAFGLTVSRYLDEAAVRDHARGPAGTGGRPLRPCRSGPERPRHGELRPGRPAGLPAPNAAGDVHAAPRDRLTCRSASPRRSAHHEFGLELQPLVDVRDAFRRLVEQQLRRGAPDLVAGLPNRREREWRGWQRSRRRRSRSRRCRLEPTRPARPAHAARRGPRGR